MRGSNSRHGLQRPRSCHWTTPEQYRWADSNRARRALMKRAVALEHRCSGGWNRTSTNQRMKLVAYQWPTPAALPRGVEPRRAAFARQPPDPRARARANADASAGWQSRKESNPRSRVRSAAAAIQRRDPDVSGGTPSRNRTCRVRLRRPTPVLSGGVETRRGVEPRLSGFADRFDRRISASDGDERLGAGYRIRAGVSALATLHSAIEPNPRARRRERSVSSWLEAKHAAVNT